MEIDKDCVADEIMNTLPTLFKGIFQSCVRDSEANEEQEFLSKHMSMSHLHVLFAIEKLGPCSISNIAKKMLISKPNMTPIIDKLILSGFIKREYSQKDRRVINVYISEEGKVFIKEKKEKIRKTIAEKLINLRHEDLSDLYIALGTIKSIFIKLNNEENSQCNEC